MAINLSQNNSQHTILCFVCISMENRCAHQQIPQNKSRAKASNESKEEKKEEETTEKIYHYCLIAHKANQIITIKMASL